MVKEPTIKELEAQMFDLTLQIEHLRSQIYFPVTVEGMELQRTWEDECHDLRSQLYFPVTVEGIELQRTWEDECHDLRSQLYFLKAENEQLESKLDKITRLMGI